MISLSGAVTFILYLVVAGIVFWLLWWIVDYAGIPQPFNKVAHVLIAVLAVFVIITMLIWLVGGTGPLFRP